jgi:hypothetical protein
MRFPIGAMTVGDVLDRGLVIFWARLPALLAVNLLVLVPDLVYALALPSLMAGTYTGGPPDLVALLRLLGTQVAVLFLRLFLMPLGSAATVYLVGQEFVGRRAGMGEAFAFAWRHFGTLLGVALVTGLMVGVGLCLFLVPGLIFAVWYAFAAQAVVLEERGVTEALSRSKTLGEGHFGRILGTLALLVALLGMAGVVNGILGQLLKPFDLVLTDSGMQFTLYSYPRYLAAQVVSYLLVVVVGSYSEVCVTLLYFDLRFRKEGFDLELAAGQSIAAKKETGIKGRDTPLRRYLGCLAVAGLLLLPAGARAEPPHPDDATIRRQTEDILSRPEFRPAGADLSALARAVRSFFEWFSPLADTQPVLFWGLIVGLVLLLVLLVAHIAWTVRRVLTVGEVALPGTEAEARRQRLSQGYQREAQERAARGEYTEAVRCLFLALVYRLDEEGRVLFQRACTNREYLALFADRPEVRRDLGMFVETLDANWYGQHATDEGRYAECLAMYEGLARRA